MSPERKVLTPTDPGYAEALDQMEEAEAAERTEGRPCGPCPWVSTDQRDKDAVADSIMQTQMRMGGWFCCHVNMGTCYGARLTYEKHLRKTEREIDQADQYLTMLADPDQQDGA